MSPELFTVTFTAAFLVGLGCTAWLIWTYGDVAPELKRNDRLILQAFVVVSALVTVAAGFFGWSGVRRLNGFPPVSWGPLATYILAMAIVLIPAYLAGIVVLIRRTRRRP